MVLPPPWITARIRWLRRALKRLLASGTGVGSLRVLLVLCIVVPLLQLLVFVTYRNQQLEAEAQVRLQRSLRIAHDHDLRIFSANEALLQHLRDLAPATAAADAPGLHPKRLKELVRGQPQVEAIWIFDRDGRPRAGSRMAEIPAGLSSADRPYFRWHREGNGTLQVSEVMTGVVSGEKFFQMSLPRFAPDGSFGGIVSITMNPAYFAGFHATLAAEEPGVAITLFRQDGVVYSRWPALESAPERMSPTGEVLSRVLRGEIAGAVRNISSLDGQKRIILFRKLGDYPVYIGVGREVGALKRDLMDELGLLVAVTGVPVLGLILAAWLAMRRTSDALASAARLQQESEARRQAEEALFQSQKMEALGRLTGGVAHDFNNALMVISGNLHLLRHASANQPSRQLDAIGRAVDSATRLTRQLLAFSRHQALSLETVQLQRRLPALHDMIEPTLGKDIELRLEVARDTAPIEVDVAELELALINLAVNARDAMPEGGRFTLRAYNAAASGEGTAAPASVVIDAIDTGQGMDPSVAARAFDPFFTTKPAGKGTGLGLSQVYALCRHAGGSVTLISAPGRGTVVRMHFPASQREVPPPSVPDPAQAVSPRTVLLVEDNAEVADVVRPVLEDMGCTVTHMQTAAPALQALDAGTQFDVLLTDVLMPGGMDGAALAQAVRARHPQVQILIMTGYAEQIQAITALGFRVLPKPFSPAALAEALEALANAPRQA